jgi:hypothetical protein
VIQISSAVSLAVHAVESFGKYWQRPWAPGLFKRLCLHLIQGVVAMYERLHMLFRWLRFAGISAMSLAFAQGFLASQQDRAVRLVWAIGFLLAAMSAAALGVSMLGTALDWNGLQERGWWLYESLDFGAVAVLRRVCSFIVRLLESLRHLHKLFNWVVLGTSAAAVAVWQHVLQPVFCHAGQFVRFVWNNPLLPLVASLGLIGLAYKIHAREIPELPSLALLLGAASVAWDSMQSAAGAVWLLLPMLGQAINEANVWWDIVVEAGTPTWHIFRSVSFAWMFYFVNVCIAKQRLHRVLRLKVVMVPLLTLASTRMLAPSIFGHVFVVMVLWCVVAIIVSVYDQLARDAVQVQFQAYRGSLQGDKLAPSAAPEKVFSGETCIICFDEYALPSDRYTLECGHQYHEPCIREWLNQAMRCPTCNDPLDKQVRLLQTVF